MSSDINQINISNFKLVLSNTGKMGAGYVLGVLEDSAHLVGAQIARGQDVDQEFVHKILQNFLLAVRRLCPRKEQRLQPGS